MRFRNRTLNWDAPMPSKPLRQRHESPKRGDSIRAIRRSRGQALDVNVQGPYWFHWPTPAKNGYTRIYDDAKKRTRRMSLRERRRPWWNWSEENVLDWRRPNGERPLTDAQGLTLCAHYGTLPIRDIKYPGAGSDPRYFEQYVENSKQHNVPAWFKTLPTMKGARGKVALCRAAAGQIALIYGKRVKGRGKRLAATARTTMGWTIKPNGTW